MDHRPFKKLLPLALIAASVAGCGGDDDDDEKAQPAAGTLGPAAARPIRVGGSPIAVAAGEAETAGPGLGAVDTVGASSAADCVLVPPEEQPTAAAQYSASAVAVAVALNAIRIIPPVARKSFPWSSEVTA